MKKKHEEPKPVKRKFPVVGKKEYRRFLKAGDEIRKLLDELNNDMSACIRAEFWGIPEGREISESGKNYKGSKREHADLALFHAGNQIFHFTELISELLAEKLLAEENAK